MITLREALQALYDGCVRLDREQAILPMQMKNARKALAEPDLDITKPVPMLLRCPECHERHIDVGAFSTKSHHTHACQACGAVWRPAIIPTVGVQFLPGVQE